MQSVLTVLALRVHRVRVLWNSSCELNCVQGYNSSKIYGSIVFFKGRALHSRQINLGCSTNDEIEEEEEEEGEEEEEEEEERYMCMLCTCACHVWCDLYVCSVYSALHHLVTQLLIWTRTIVHNR